MERADVEFETCGVNFVHEEAVTKAREELPDDRSLSGAADFFKMFADSTRMRILCALMSGELCVCDLTCLMGVSQSAVSHQLRLLKAARAVKTRRSGKTIYYSLDDDHVTQLLRVGLEHISHGSDR